MSQSVRFFFIAFILYSSILAGQTDSSFNLKKAKNNQRYIFDIGIVGGINYLDYNSERYTRYTQSIEIQQGISSGMHFHYNFGKHSSLFTAIIYEQKKRKEIYTWNYRQETFDYITFPALYKFSIGKRNLFFMNGGPFLSVLAKKTEENMYYTETFKSYRTELGIAAGLGFRIPITKKLDVTLDAKKYFSMLQMKTNFEYSLSDNYMLGVNYKFGKMANKVPKRDSILELYVAKKERKIFVKFFYSPQLSYRRGIGNKTTVQGINTGQSWSSTSYDSKKEIPKYGNEIGVMVEFLMGKQLSLNTGISYETQGFQTDSSVTTYTSGWGDNIGYFSYTTYENSYDYSFYYISNPIIINYSIKKNKNRIFYFGAGPEINFLFKSKLNNSVYYYGQKSNDANNSLSPFVIFYTANIGFSIPLEKKLLFFEPNFKIQHGVRNMPNNFVKHQLLSAGCRVGLKF